MTRGRVRAFLSGVAYRHRVAAVIYIFILLPFLVLGILIVRRVWSDRVQAILEQNRGVLRLGVESVDSMLFSGLLKLSFVSVNSEITAFLDRGDYTDLAYDLEVYDSIERTIDAMLADSPGVRLVIYPTDPDAYNGEYVEKLERLEGRLKDDAAEVIETVLSLDWEGQLWRYEKATKDGDSLGTVRAYKAMRLLDKTLALTELEVGVSRIVRSIKGVYPEGSRVIYRPDTSGVLVTMEVGPVSGSTQVWKVVTDERAIGAPHYQPIEIELRYSPGSFTLLIPRSQIRSLLPGFLAGSILALALSITVLFVIVELASYLITRRLSLLIDSVNEAGTDSIGPPVADRYPPDDDIGKLAGKFHTMLRKVREGYQRALEHENQRKQFELELLQSQINPHFLYNALSTLKWNCKDETMASAIDSMVQYYRLALNRGDPVVEVSHEVKLVEVYLQIQRYTYESEFEYRFDVDEAVMRSRTLRHLLQPLVENALMHGIRGLASGGMIEISGKVRDDTLTFTVRDNGVGIPAETVRQLLAGEYRAAMGGYGLRNVRRRINLYYGPRSTLALESRPGDGTRIAITLPVERASTEIAP